MDVALDGRKTLTCMKAVGQVMETLDITSKRHQFALDNFPKGIYFIILSQNGLPIETERFIRQ